MILLYSIFDFDIFFVVFVECDCNFQVTWLFKHQGFPLGQMSHLEFVTTGLVTTNRPKTALKVGEPAKFPGNIWPIASMGMVYSRES